MSDEEKLYERLSILDNKCSALLSVSSVVLALNVIPAALGKISGPAWALSIFTALSFLVVSLLSLYVIWIRWEVDEKLLIQRTRVYRGAVILTAMGLIAMATLIITVLVT